MKITVLDNILKANDAIAEEIREELASHKVLAINLMSSPGAGKTTLLERTIEKLEPLGIHVGVVEGDIATTRDSDRLRKFDIPIVQINTGSACHLDANMTRSALSNLDCSAVDILFIENVGNLVCPAEFKIGEDHKVMMLSVTEGDEKPLKYPLMFRESSAMLINKIDLLAYTNFSMDEARKNAHSINPKLAIFPLSCTTGEGLNNWLKWMTTELEKKRKRLQKKTKKK
ncbi:MAG: hydrogenase accessory protein HypB [Candidatus Abyssobacteria bacterium SURF_17]|uniref:Hydrogenase accessory protein HypB n=1 Tax=Candidatus Abyssobacteria bacterium SURF_17 TaxID=2093361 RepID=A0A419EZB8_9BACT|nr:MAG: hydrogenase accessory protein HypB [Candidatus Abyssubacteria bacterium SURF_17]